MRAGPTPDWSQAAQALVDGCVDLSNDEDRVALLAAVCDGLGDALYPAFLRLLWSVGRQGDHGARAAVAQALVHALRTGRLPSGRRSAWGASRSSAAVGYGSTRSLGPIEYLCTWHSQGEGEPSLSAARFQVAACALVELIDASPLARRLYCDKLLADANDPLSGAWTRTTRTALAALATAWADGMAPAEVCARFIAELPTAAPPSLAALVVPGQAAWR